MLGGMARWLRMLGYETEYDPKAGDNVLLQLSTERHAILLTRDKELYTRAVKRKIQIMLVPGETEKERLAQLARALGLTLEIDMTKTRCPHCGSSLRELPRDGAMESVPAASLKLYDRFWQCIDKECNKTYWVGSHWKRITETLEQARKLSVGG